MTHLFPLPQLNQQDRNKKKCISTQGLQNKTMKLLKHDRDSVGDFQYRVLIHVPIGFLIGLVSLIPFTSLGENLKNLFEAYENSEDVHTSDEAWKDYFGAIAGVVILSVLVFLAIIIALWRVIK